MPDDHYIYNQIALAQIQADVFVPYGYSGRTKAERKQHEPVGKFMDMLKKEFDHLSNNDYHKWSKIFVTVEPFDELGLENHLVLLRLCWVYPDDRRQGLSALALRCLRECSDYSKAGIVAFSNPIEMTRTYSSREDIKTAYRAGAIDIEYTLDENAQKKMGYRFKEAGYNRINWDDKDVVQFCDKYSSYIYLPSGLNEEAKQKVEPRLVNE